jgi:hypothetical protein
MQYRATASVKVGPEQFVLEGEIVDVAEQNDHVNLLVSQGLLVPTHHESNDAIPVLPVTAAPESIVSGAAKSDEKATKSSK